MSLLGVLMAAIGILILLVAALGVLRLPDALSRQHAATKAATLAVSMFACGLLVTAAVSGWGWGWISRLVIMLAILLISLPIASHALARSGMIESGNKENED